MTLRESARRIEIGLGLGMAACLLWTLLDAVGMTALLRLGLEPGPLAVAWVTAAHLLSLWLAVGLSSLAAGVLLVGAGVSLALTIVGVAVGFRAAVYLLAGTLDPPWRSLPEALALLAGAAVALLASIGCLRLGSRMAGRRDSGGGAAGSG